MAGNWKPILEAEAEIKKLARSVVAIVDIDNWEKLSDNSFQICQAFATGFINRTKKVITAGHVIENHKIEKAIVVFDFTNDGNGDTIVPAKNVYFIENKDNIGGSDWGWIILDKPVHCISLIIREIKSQKENGDIDNYDKQVFAIGHPGGQPTRYSGIANVEVVEEDPTIFIAGFPVVEGASGAPVFSIIDHAVVGVIIEKLHTQAKCLKADLSMGSI